MSKPMAAARPPARPLEAATVLEAAARVFRERGFGATSMADVARELGVSRPALYYYFPSKDAILASLVEAVTVSIAEQARSLAESPRECDPGARLHALVARHAGFIAAHASIFHVLQQSQPYLPAPLRTVNAQGKDAVLRSFEKVISAGVRRGTFRAVQPSVAALAVLGMCNGCASWFRPDGPMSADAVGELIADMAVASLALPGERAPRADLAEPLARARVALGRLNELIELIEPA